MNDSLKKKSKKSRKKIAYTVFFILLFGNLVLLLFLLILTDSVVTKHKPAIALKTLPQIFPSPAAYPMYKKIAVPDISAESAIVVDSDANIIMYYKNDNQVLPMASSTKIMTAMVALSYYKKNSILTDETFPVDGSIAGLTLGERMTFEQALYGLLLPSGNDVAVMLAQNYPGGMSAFIQQMNATAKSLHMNNTYYEDVDGLSTNNVTSAFDLSILAGKAMEVPFFKQVVGTKYKKISNITGNETHSLTNLNKLLGSQGVNGIKTGFTDEAEGVLVTSKVERGHTFIIVVLRSQDRFLDTEKLLQMINNNVTFVSLRP